jgi:hypothetical protein
LTKRTAKSKSASDPQADRCYKWQYKWADWNRKAAPLQDCRAIIKRACKVFGIPVTPVRSISKHNHYSSYQEETHSIRLLPSHQNIPMALHEVAHAICHKLFPRAPDHGPTFVGIFLGLLEQAGVAPKKALQASAREAGLKWRRFTYVNKKARKSK